MQLTVNFPIRKEDFEITHLDKISLIGSCFSEEIAKKLVSNCFQIETNPFGVVFHPVLISKFLNETIENTKTERVLKKDNILLSWDANSTIYNSVSEDAFIKDIHLIRENYKSHLIQSKVLFITFGTAWGYRLIETNELVANCHKLPARDFSKELTESAEIVSNWRKTIELIQKINPEIKIIFTVSPVRHIKDGIIENNQSKAILIESIRQITKLYNCHYFPSYEIVIDELRDYRFYKTDFVHPSEQAINYVWERFQNTYFNSETIELNKEILLLKNMLSHRSIHAESLENKKMQASIKKKLALFQLNHPTIILK